MPHHSDDELEDLRRMATEKLRKVKKEGSSKEEKKVSKLQRQPKSKVEKESQPSDNQAAVTSEESPTTNKRQRSPEKEQEQAQVEQEEEREQEPREPQEQEEEQQVEETTKQDDVAEYEEELETVKKQKEKARDKKSGSKKMKKERSMSREKVEKTSKRSPRSPSPKSHRKEKKQPRSRSKHRKDNSTSASSSKREKEKAKSRSVSRERTKKTSERAGGTKRERRRSKSPVSSKKESKKTGKRSTRERSPSKTRTRQRKLSRSPSKERKKEKRAKDKSRSRSREKKRSKSVKRDGEGEEEDKKTNGNDEGTAVSAENGEGADGGDKKDTQEEGAKEKDASKEEGEKKERKRTRKSGWDDRSQVQGVAIGGQLNMQQLIQAQIQARAQQVSQLHNQKLLALKTAQQETAARVKQQEILLANRLLQLQQPQPPQPTTMDLLAEQKQIIERRVYIGSLSYDLTEDHIRAPFAACGNIVKIDMPREAGLNRSKGFCFVEYDSKQSADVALSTMNGIMLAGRPIKVGKPSSANAGVAPILPPTVASGGPGIALLAGPGAAAGVAAPQVLPQQLQNLQRLALLGLVPGAAPAVAAAGQAALLQLAAAQQQGAVLPGAQVLPPIGLGNNTLTAVQHNASKNRIYVGSVLWDLTSEHLKAVFEAFGTVVAVELIPNPETGKHKGYGFVEFANEKSAEDAIANMDGFELCGRQLKVGRAQYSVTAKRPDMVGELVTGAQPSLLPGLLPLPSELLPATTGEPAGTESPKDLDSSPHIDRFTLMKRLMESREGPQTNVVVLKNMISAEELDPGFEQEVKEECETFGPVSKVVVHVPESKEVHVYVQFKLAAHAVKAKEALQKRWFGGRVIIAEMFEQAKFESGAFS